MKIEQRHQSSQLRFLTTKGEDGLLYVKVGKPGETAVEKIRRVASSLGETIDRVLFPIIPVEANVLPIAADMTAPQQTKH